METWPLWAGPPPRRPDGPTEGDGRAAALTSSLAPGRSQEKLGREVPLSLSWGRRSATVQLPPPPTPRPGFPRAECRQPWGCSTWPSVVSPKAQVLGGGTPPKGYTLVLR